MSKPLKHPFGSCRDDRDPELCGVCEKMSGAGTTQIKGASQLKDDWPAILSQLGPEWDSYDAKPITKAAIQTVMSFCVVPCHHGGIRLEIHRDGYDIEIIVGPDGKIMGGTISHD